MNKRLNATFLSISSSTYVNVGMSLYPETRAVVILKNVRNLEIEFSLNEFMSFVSPAHEDFLFTRYFANDMDEPDRVFNSVTVKYQKLHGNRVIKLIRGTNWLAIQEKTVRNLFSLCHLICALHEELVKKESYVQEKLIQFATLYRFNDSVKLFRDRIIASEFYNVNNKFDMELCSNVILGEIMIQNSPKYYMPNNNNKRPLEC